MKKNGFTLIELLAVIVVIAIISVVTVPFITGVINKVKVSALKQSAEGLVEASILYRAKYPSDDTVRFDISNNVITSEDTTNMLSYKGEVKTGTVIIDSKGRSVVCVTDGKRSAYKNYNDNNIAVSNNETCNVPTGRTIVFLGNEATIIELSNQELTQQLAQAQETIAELQNELNTVKGKVTTLENKPDNTVYDDEEHIVGTWIDGKPVYERIVIVTSNFGENTIVNANAEELISFEGIRTMGTGSNAYQNTGSYYYSSTDYFFVYGGITEGNNYI